MSADPGARLWRGLLEVLTPTRYTTHGKILPVIGPESDRSGHFYRQA